VFEENYSNKFTYEYSIVSLEKLSKNNEPYFQDIVKKTNDLQLDFSPCCIFSDEKITFIIFKRIVKNNNMNDSILLNLT
jgi:hypothetical protein